MPGRVDADPIALADVVDPVPCLEHLDVRARFVQAVRHAQPARARPRHYDSHLTPGQLPRYLCQSLDEHIRQLEGKVS